MLKIYNSMMLWCSFFISAVLGGEKSPNIILILVDDHGWSQLSSPMDSRFPEACSKYLETPNIDRIANGGLRFTNGYSPAPLCTPTRRSIQCGASAARSGTEFKSSYVPAEHMTIPKALKMANPNYQCAHFGKWGELMISTPEECGYDLSDGMTGNNTGGMENKGEPLHIVEDPKRTETVTDRAIQFIQKNVSENKPFYCQISYYAMHLRVEALKKTYEKYQSKGKPDRAYTQAWAAMLEELDANIGRVLNELGKQGVETNTYVFYTTDNGGRGTIPGGDSKALPPNYPVTGAKHSLWEGGIRVPFFVKGPSIEPMGYCHTPVVGYDFLSTFYQLASGTPKLFEGVDGGSFSDLLKNPSISQVERPEEALFFHRPGRKESVIRKGEYKLIIRYSDTGEIEKRELYQVDRDISEKNNLFSSKIEKTQSMEKELFAFLEKVNAEKVDPKKLKHKKKPKKKD